MIFFKLECNICRYSTAEFTLHPSSDATPAKIRKAMTADRWTHEPPAGDYCPRCSAIRRDKTVISEQ